MDAEFLSKFMRTSKEITGAERCLSVDPDLQVLDAINLDISTPSNIATVARTCLTQAMETGQVVITNNIITDPSQAPVTNTNFSDLRVVVAIPIGRIGAVYLDQHIRRGIIPRETTEKLAILIDHVFQEGLWDLSKDELIALYEQI